MNRAGNTSVNDVSQANQGGNKVLIAFIGGLIIGLLAGYFWFGGDSNNTSNSGNNGDNGASVIGSISRLAGNAIFVSNQKPGETVEVGLVQFENPGFVVIQEDNDGKPGRVIGSKLFPAGQSEGIIELNESTEDGKTYHAVLWDDNADNKFAEADDVAIPTDDGVLMSTFEVGDDYEVQDVPAENI